VARRRAGSLGRGGTTSKDGECRIQVYRRGQTSLTITAREGKASPADRTGSAFTTTNIGVFGVDAGTPIINPGKAGIIALGAIRQKPWVVDGEVRPRWVTTVSGSFDHRVVDGDGISRFIADVASVLEEPALLLD